MRASPRSFTHRTSARIARLLAFDLLLACGGSASTTSVPSSVADPSIAPTARATAGANATAPPTMSTTASTSEHAAASSATSTSAKVTNGEEVPFSTGGTGTLAARDVKKILHAKMPSFIACYQTAITNAPALRGEFAVRFRVEPDGTVLHAETTGPPASPTFLSCLSDGVRALKFGKPHGGYVDVVYPLVFDPA